MSELTDGLDEFGAVAGCELHVHPGDVDFALRVVCRDYGLRIVRCYDVTPGYCYVLCPPEPFTGTLLLDDSYPRPHAHVEDSVLVPALAAAASVQEQPRENQRVRRRHGRRQNTGAL